MNLRLNITDDQGTLLGQLELTADDLRAAMSHPMAADALVSDIADQAGVR